MSMLGKCVEKEVAFTRALTSRECFEEESVSFSCEVNKEGVALTWMKDGSILVPEEGIRTETEGTLHRLIIDRAEFSQTGTYTASIVKGVESTAQLIVQGIHSCSSYTRFLSLIQILIENRENYIYC